MEFLDACGQCSGWKSGVWIRALASPLFELQWANAEFAVLRLRESKARRVASGAKWRDFQVIGPLLGVEADFFAWVWAIFWSASIVTGMPTQNRRGNQKFSDFPLMWSSQY